MDADPPRAARGGIWFELVRVGRTIAAGGAAAVLLAAGWTAAVVIHDPDEAAVEPVVPSLMTAPVTRGSIDATYHLDGVVVTAATTSLVVSAPESRIPVISQVTVPAGSEVAWCSPLLAVSGRPVFALTGVVPAYRDLTIGDTGDDVRQLQEALRSCGLYRGASDGALGPLTMAAVEQMYRSAGYVVDRETHAEETKPEDEASPQGGGSDADAADAARAGSSTTSRTTESIPWVRAREIAFLPGPGRMLTVPVLGQSVGTDPVATVAHHGMALRLEIPVAVRAQLSAGLPVTVTAGEHVFAAELPALPEEPSVDEDTGARRYVASIPLPEAGVDLDQVTARVDIVVGDNAQYPCVVPATAVQRRADGSAYVLQVLSGSQRVDGSDEVTQETIEVSVDLIATGDGQVAVEPHDGTLDVDDRVVVGASP